MQFEYSIRQLTSDSSHLVNEEIVKTYILRDSSVTIENRLQDINSVKRTITATKDWPEGMPNPAPNVELTLYADGVSTKDVSSSVQMENYILIGLVVILLVALLLVLKKLMNTFR